MKRMICLLLALLLCGTAALAEPFAFTMADYIGCAQQLNPRLGFSVTWTDATEEMGFTSLCGTYADMKGVHAVYLHNDPVMAMQIAYMFDVTGITSEMVDQYAVEFGQIATSAAVCAWVAEHIEDVNLEAGLSTVNNGVQAELEVLFSPLLNMPDDFSGTAKGRGTLYGYPAMFEVELDAENSSCMFLIMIVADEAMLDAL